MTMTTLRKCWIWTWTCATRTPRIIDPDGRPMTCRVLLTLLLLLCTPAAWSQLPPSDNAPRDHAILSRLPGSEIVDYRVLDRTNYRLALGRRPGPGRPARRERPRQCRQRRAAAGSSGAHHLPDSPGLSRQCCVRASLRTAAGCGGWRAVPLSGTGLWQQ